MGNLITKRTRLKIGDLIAWQSGDGLTVYQIAQIKKKKDLLGWNQKIVGLNKSPDHKEFKRKNKVDLYTWIYQSDLIENYKANRISVIELIVHYESAKTETKYNDARIRNLIAERDAIGYYTP